MVLTLFSIVGWISVFFLNRRFRFRAFLVSRWLFPSCIRLILPPAVILYRFFMALLVFIFGMVALLSLL
jgi:hypothetical protein